MYYYYFYEPDEAKKVVIKLKFQFTKGEPAHVEEFNNFMKSLNELHKRVVFLTQPEYNNNDLSVIDEVSMLSYNQLEIDKFHRENPFFLEMSFQIANVEMYWVLWKILIDICEKYGSTTQELRRTIFEKLHFFKNLFKDLLVEKRSESVKLLLDLENNYADLPKKEILIDKIEKMVKSFLIDKSSRDFYNKMCFGAITITNFVSLSEDIEEFFFIKEE